MCVFLGVTGASGGALGTIASGATQNLVHRAASVALKEERRHVLMPRDTPLLEQEFAPRRGQA